MPRQLSVHVGSVSTNWSPSLTEAGAGADGATQAQTLVRIPAETGSGSDSATPVLVVGGSWPPVQPLRGFEQWPSHETNINGSALQDMGGVAITGNNQTIEGKKNFQLGTSGSPLTGTTIVRGCLFENSGDNNAACLIFINGTLLMEYCTMRPTGRTDSTATVNGAAGYQYGICQDGAFGCFVTGASTFRNVHIWGFGNATQQSGSTQSTPIKWYDSVVENPRLDNAGYADHTDGIGLPGGGSDPYLEIHNTWVTGNGANTQGLAFQNNTGSVSNYNNMVIDGCVFGGFGKMIAVQNGQYPTTTAPLNMTFTNNVWYCGYAPIFSPLYLDISSGAGSVWHNNKVWVPVGSSFGDHATQDGLFWLPQSQNISGTGSAALAPFVSATDF